MSLDNSTRFVGNQTNSSSNSTTELLNDVNEKALKNARARCTELLSRPESLSDIENIKRRIKTERDERDLELKNAIKSQLESIETATKKLKKASVNCSELITSTNDLFQNLKKAQNLSRQVAGLKEINKNHQQLKSIITNFQYIFDFSNLMKQGQDYLNQSRPDLLKCHEILLNLENARNTCLLESHKNSNDPNPVHNSVINNFFKDTINLSNNLESKLFSITTNMINIARDDPQLITNCARIIEREEKLDEYAESLKDRFNFITPQRPKKLKEKFYLNLEISINQKFNDINENSFKKSQSSSVNTIPFFLSTNEIMKTMTNDVKVIQTFAMLCFPKSYQLSKWFMNEYWHRFSTHLMQVAQEANSEETEIILISLGQCFSNEYLGSIKKLNPDALEPLISEETRNKLVQKYAYNTISQLKEWIEGSLKLELESWKQKEKFLETADKLLQTRLINTIDGHLRVKINQTKIVLDESTSFIVVKSVITLISFVDFYWDVFHDFFTKSAPSEFNMDDDEDYRFQCLVATINNTTLMSEQFKEIFDPFVSTIDLDEYNEKYSIFQAKLKMMANASCQLFIDELHASFDILYSQIFTEKWAENSNYISEIFRIFEDHENDLEKLSELDLMLQKIYTSILQQYYLNIFRSNHKFKDKGTLAKFCQKITDEINELQDRAKAELEPDTFDTISFFINTLLIYMSILQAPEKSMTFELDQTENILRQFPSSFLESTLIKRGMGKSQVKDISSQIEFDENSPYNNFIGFITDRL